MSTTPALKLAEAPATPKPKTSAKPKVKVVPKLNVAEQRTVGQFIAALAAGFLPLASYVIAHHEVADRWWMWGLVIAALAFSAPTLVDWAQRWCKGFWKAVGFTVLLEGVMVFSRSDWLAVTGLAILVIINCHSAWALAGKHMKGTKQ